MTAFILGIIFAFIYAFLRGKGDSYLREGPWKQWSMYKDIFVGIVFTVLITFVFEISYVSAAFYFISMAGIYSLIFDCTIGFFFGQNIFYIGTGAWDRQIRKTFLYGKQYNILGWKFTNKGHFYAFVKLFYIAIFGAGYFAIIY